MSPEVYSRARRHQDALVLRDVVAAWVKVMELDRFDLRGSGSSALHPRHDVGVHPPPPSHWGDPHHQPWVVQRGPDLGWAVALWVIAGLSLVGTLLCAAMATYGFWISHHMAEDGVTTTAVATQVDGDDVTVEFTTEDGRSVTAEIFFWRTVPATGEELMITYDPDDEPYALPAGSNEDRIFAIVLAVVAFIGLLVASGAAVGAALIHRARSRSSKSLVL